MFAAALLVCAACTACTKEIPGETSAGIPDGGQELTFTVMDGGFGPGAEAQSRVNASETYSQGDAGVNVTEECSPATRAVENGYATVFTAGDACGLYVTRGDEIIYSNVKLTAEADAAGNIVWKAPEGTVLQGKLNSDESYFLYYPYQDDMTGKVLDLSTVASVVYKDFPDDTFFKDLIDNWQPATDQSSYAAYTASDLMTAKAGGNGGSKISFTMTHRMSLAVIEMPKTSYTFSSTAIPDYLAAPDVTFGEAKPTEISKGSFRYILNSRALTGGLLAPSTTIEGSYDNGNKTFSFTTAPNSGTYKRYLVDGGATTAIDNYTLNVGDFILLDGTLLPKDTELTNDQKDAVAGIVFWTPAETAKTGSDRVYPASLMDDRIMAAEHPDCTHGLAVAIKDTKRYAFEWQELNGQEAIETVFQKRGSGYNPNETGYRSICVYGDSDNRILGYQNTKILQAYNSSLTEAKEDYIVKPVSGFYLGKFIEENPAPGGSTGWYIPSIKELVILLDGDIDNSLAGGVATDNPPYKTVEQSITKAGGDVFLGGTGASKPYWSSSEAPDDTNSNVGKYAWFVSGSSGATSNGLNIKDNNFYVRAVCAF